MKFMNTWEIDRALNDTRLNFVQHRAAFVLGAVRDIANANSDGWCYWKAPASACKKLMDIVDGTTPATEENLKKACVPVKSFCTKHKFVFPLQEV